MPPKRKAADAAAGNASKKSKASSTDNTPEKPPVPRSKRWSKGVSGSANADTEYRKKMMHDPAGAWEFVCRCRPVVGSDDDNEDEDEDDEDEDDDDDEGDGLPSCDRGKTCLCRKPSKDHPDHPYIYSLGGIQKFNTIATMCSLRDPDLFGMYIYNDFAGYGLLEMVGNLLLDFEEAKDDWKQQWYICEATTLFFHKYNPMPLFMIDDSEGLDMFLHCVRTMFLTMMATLERNDLLKPGSEIKNLGMVMGLAIRLDAYAQDMDSFEDLPKYLYAYAAKHNIVLHDVPKDDEPEPVPATGKGSLPDPRAKKNNPWGFAAELKKLAKEQNVGGDEYDITTMSAAERKNASFTKKDPLGAEEIKALKEGLVMQLA
ncbi:hypothetical protein DTO027B9_4833 [Paecilomyces variotii]|nr:hypothetical protein DTO027B9_4833 [Paecilomyces variotii]